MNVNGKYGRINKPLFDAVSVNLARLNGQDCEKLLLKKQKVNHKYANLLKQKDFIDIITNGTAKPLNVQSRYEKIGRIFQEILADD
jgi:hypothetical protein